MVYCVKKQKQVEIRDNLLHIYKPLRNVVAYGLVIVT